MGLRSLILFFIGCTISSAQVNWMTMDEALAAQKSKPKKIIVDVYTSWCGPCKLLDKNTFGNAEISSFINQNYYPVKFNAEGKEEVNFNGNRFENPRYDPNRKGRNARHQFTAYLGITGYPSIHSCLIFKRGNHFFNERRLLEQSLRTNTKIDSLTFPICQA